jgi:hypothetical protein
MRQETILLVAVIAAAAIMMRKKLVTAAPPALAGSASAPIQNTNMNSDMWSRILGGEWRNLVQASGTGGTVPFLMKSLNGTPQTSDGKPITTGDPVNDWMVQDLGLDGNAIVGNEQSPGAEAFINNLFPLTELSF